MAMGHVVAGIAGNLIPYWIGVLLLVLVIIVYETLGGLRAVAWTDVAQGSMLLIGLFGLLLCRRTRAGSLASPDGLAEHSRSREDRGAVG